MRIAFITPEYITETNFDGGLANYLGRVCPALVEMGHEVVVIVASDTHNTFIKDEIEVHRVRIESIFLRWLNRLSLSRLSIANRWILQSWALNRVCSKLHHNRPIDLIQYTSYTASALFRVKRVPAVVRLSSFNPLLRKYYAKPMNLSARLEDWLEIKAISKADGIFGPSRIIAESVQSVLKNNIHIIESPFCNKNMAHENPFGNLLAKKRYLLFFGSIGLLKGVDTIASILEALLENNPDLYFIFAGKDMGYRGRPMMDHVWESAGLYRGRVIFLGKMPHNYLGPLIKNATTVVLPSKIDNFPNACLEAMYLKRIVIGTRHASFEQLIDDGINGFLTEIDSPKKLLEVINKVLELPKKSRDQIGTQAAKRIDSLKPEIVVRELINYYRTVIHR